MIYLKNNTDPQSINIPYSVNSNAPVQKRVQKVKEFTVNQYGQSVIMPDSGYTSMEKVNLTAPVTGATVIFEPQGLFDYRNTYYASGTPWSALTVDADAFANQMYQDGYVYAQRNIEAESVQLSVSANGIYNATIGQYGEGYIKKVIVDVPSGGVNPYFHYSGNTDFYFSINNTTTDNIKLRIRFWLNKWPDNEEHSIFEWSGIKFCVGNGTLYAEYEDSHERWYDVDINAVALNRMEEIVIDSNGEYLRINDEWFGPSSDDDYRENYSGYVIVNPDDVGGQDSVYIENIITYEDDNITESVIGVTFPQKGLMEKGGNVILLN